MVCWDWKTQWNQKSCNCNLFNWLRLLLFSFWEKDAQYFMLSHLQTLYIWDNLGTNFLFQVAQGPSDFCLCYSGPVGFFFRKENTPWTDSYLSYVGFLKISVQWNSSLNIIIPVHLFNAFLMQINFELNCLLSVHHTNYYSLKWNPASLSLLFYIFWISGLFSLI